jgi:Raf kinase inhibitor-like YbhB/YbcL family protein
MGQASEKSGGRLAVRVAGARLMGLVVAAVTLATLLAASLAVAADARAAGKGDPFTLASPEIGQGKTMADDQVFNGFGCKGKNLSPALSWSGAPAGTKSFAVLVHDPDAPTAGGFWHWVVYNIPADAISIPAAAGDVKKKIMPPGIVQGRNDFGAYGYGGPCPPPGKPHHYHFQIFALKVPKLDVPADASARAVSSNVDANKIAAADLVGLYGR